MRLKKIILPAAAMLALAVCLTGCEQSENSANNSPSESVSDDNSKREKQDTYEETIRVNPDKGQDFDAYEITVKYNQEEGVLTSVEITSEWGIKRSENERYSGNALCQYTSELAAGKTSESGFDAATGATCASASLWNTYDNAYSAMGWDSVSKDISPLVNGEVVEPSSHEEEEESKPNEENEEKDKNGGNKGSSTDKKGENSLDVKVKTLYFGEENGWRTYKLIMPDGYAWTEVKLIRLNNSAYMPMKQDVTNIYNADLENGVFKLNMECDEAKAALELKTLTIAAVLTSKTDETVTGTVHVEIDLTDTTVTTS